MDRLANALIRAATTDVGDGVVDILICRLRVLPQQRGSGHDLSGLAIAALRHVVLQPRSLHRMAHAVARQTFDRGDMRLAGATHRYLARAHGHPVQMYGARTTLRDAA